MSLVIDGVFFQLAQSGIARVWREILPRLTSRLDMPLVILDRGGMDVDLPNVEIVPFPTFKIAKHNPGDSSLLERVCRHYDAKAFMSTYYTSPIETPSVLLIYDMIPERLGFDLTMRDWQEKETAISHARRQVCISANTRKDVLEFYPELDPALVTVAHCGVDPLVFRPRDAQAVLAFRQKYGLTRPYFMFVGSRLQTNNYKNSGLFFDALPAMDAIDFDVVCIGGEKDRPAVTDPTDRVRIVQMDLSDEELALAYGGAAALVYPSLYEGFGMPVVEAMACGCPVICTAHGSLGEVAGDAALRISGHSKDEMIDALARVQDPAVCDNLVAAGIARAARFRWEPLADQLAAVVDATVQEAATGLHRDFYAGWARLRRFQGEVDTLL